MDGRLYLWLNGVATQHPWLGHAAGTLESVAVPLFALATVALWLVARPGDSGRWKRASASALAAAAIALLANQAVARVWERPRPFVAHPDATVFVARSHDPSFPSDHAAAAFAIGTAVLLFDRLVGTLFLCAAGLVAIGRVVAGVHYPADVLAGALVGVVAALVVVRLGRPVVARAVRLVERLTDPVVARVRGWAGAIAHEARSVDR